MLLELIVLGLESNEELLISNLLGTEPEIEGMVSLLHDRVVH